MLTKCKNILIVGLLIKLTEADIKKITKVNGGRSAQLIGGYIARNGEFPYQVALVEGGTTKLFCGGSILNDWWILTAAHCVSKPAPQCPEPEAPNIVDVLLGEVRFKNSRQGFL